MPLFYHSPAKNTPIFFDMRPFWCFQRKQGFYPPVNPLGPVRGLPRMVFSRGTRNFVPLFTSLIMKRTSLLSPDKTHFVPRMSRPLLAVVFGLLCSAIAADAANRVVAWGDLS
jgi:hypothetical protein